MSGEKLWKILCTTVGNFRILVLFPSFNAYEMVDEFETFCEKIKQITNGPLISSKLFKGSKLACFNDINFSRGNQKLSKLHSRFLGNYSFPLL